MRNTKNYKTETLSKLKSITRLNFKRYGYIIDHDGLAKSLHKNGFKIITRERKSLGWRIAYLIIRDKNIKKLEQHPD